MVVVLAVAVVAYWVGKLVLPAVIILPLRLKSTVPLRVFRRGAATRVPARQVPELRLHQSLLVQVPVGELSLLIRPHLYQVHPQSPHFSLGMRLSNCT
jgi:hypothetical protein